MSLPSCVSRVFHLGMGRAQERDKEIAPMAHRIRAITVAFRAAATSLPVDSEGVAVRLADLAVVEAARDSVHSKSLPHRRAAPPMVETSALPGLLPHWSKR